MFQINILKHCLNLYNIWVIFIYTKRYFQIAFNCWNKWLLWVIVVWYPKMVVSTWHICPWDVTDLRSRYSNHIWEFIKIIFLSSQKKLGNLWLQRASLWFLNVVASVHNKLYWVLMLKFVSIKNKCKQCPDARFT